MERLANGTSEGTLRAQRVRELPIVQAGQVPGYEPIFNAGLLYREGTYHLFARGVRSGYRLNTGDGPRFLDYVSDILVFDSRDGIRYKFRYVLATPGQHGSHAFEDPRVQRVRSNGESQVVMTYTDLPPIPDGDPWRIGVQRLTYADRRFHLDEASGSITAADAATELILQTY